MRLPVKSFVGVLMGFAFIVKLLLAGAAPLPQASHTVLQTLVSQGSHQKLNKEGEHYNHCTSIGSQTSAGSHAAKIRSYAAGYLSVAGSIILSFADYSLPAAHERARHFTPLFHFLLYPKHWFW